MAGLVPPRPPADSALCGDRPARKDSLSSSRFGRETGRGIRDLLDLLLLALLLASLVGVVGAVDTQELPCNNNNIVSVISLFCQCNIVINV